MFLSLTVVNCRFRLVWGCVHIGALRDIDYISKSKCMFFHQSQKSIIYQTITMNSVDIEKIDNFNFLSLIINKNLKWNSHVNLVLLYNSLILPHMTYGILAWGDHQNKVSLLQKNVLRIITLSKLFAYSEPLLKQLSMIKFEDMIQIQQINFYYWYLNAKLPSHFLTLIFNQNPHNYFTRSNDLYIDFQIKK